MLVPEVYQSTYPIQHIANILGIPIYLIGLITNKILTTAPYVTDCCHLNDLTPEEFRHFANEALQLKKLHQAKSLILKVRRPELAAALEGEFSVDEAFVTSEMKLFGDPDQMFREGIPAKTRNQTRKGLKMPHTLQIGGAELLEDFYQVYSRSQRDLGSPPHAKSFFGNILDKIGSSRVFVIYMDGIPVSSAITIVRDQKLYHPFAGTLNDYKATSINNVLYWSLMKYGIERQCQVFDMGRSQKGSGNAQYKKNWGANELQLFMLYHPAHGTVDYSDMKFVVASTLWKRLPLFLSESCGPSLARLFP